MFEEICKKYNLDVNRFNRNYYVQCIKKGEKLDKEDLRYCFIESNLQLLECKEVFNVSYGKLRTDLQFYGLFKSPLQQQLNREKNCLKKYNVVNPSCLEEVREKRKQTNLKRYGCIYASSNAEIKAKIKKTMNEKYGGNAPACNKEVLEKMKKTNLERYGADWSWQTEEGKKHREEICLGKFGVKNLASLPEVREKAKQTKIEKYGRDNVGQFGTEEHKKVIEEKYGVEYVSQSKEIQEKIKATNLKKYNVACILELSENQRKAKEAILKKYGVTSITLVPEIVEKMEEGRKRWRNSAEYPEKIKQITERGWETRKKNNTCNTSKDEDYIFDILIKTFPETKRNHKAKEYPFHCDFYIPEINVWIEYQGSWVHGKKTDKNIYGPFDKNNPLHLKVLEHWKQKANELTSSSDIPNKRNGYTNAIEIWTIRDPLKRQVAKENNLNWLEFFTVKDFLDWYNECLV